MSRALLRRLTPLGAISLSAIGVMIACAETESNAPLEEEREDGSVLPRDGAAPDADAAPSVDSGIEAGTCTTMTESSVRHGTLCIASVPIAAHVHLTSVWGSNASDVWAVGAQGTILHYGGTAWEKADTSVPDGSSPHTIRSVWVARPDDVWLADGRTLRHSTGWQGPSATSWSTFTYSTSQAVPTAIRGNDSTIWLTRGLSTGGGQRLVKFTGWGDAGPVGTQNFGPTFGMSLAAVAIARPDEVWAAGSFPLNDKADRSRIYRVSLAASDAGADAAAPTWQLEEHDSRTTKDLNGIWADEAGVWVVGEGGLLLRMTRSAVPGKVFEIVPNPNVADLYGIFGFASDDVWAVGEASTVLHWNGSTWTRIATPFDSAPDKPRLLAVWGAAPDDVWIAGYGTMLHFEGLR